jgi:glycosyltransferase involved in cell wall biosynthesis
VHVGLLIYGSLNTISGGFIYDRHLVRYLKSQGDRVDLIPLPWRPYARGLLDNLHPGLTRRLRQAAFDVLIQDELVHPSCCWLNHRLRAGLPYPLVAIVHHLRCREDRPAWHNRLYRRVEKSYLNSLDGCVCVSRTTQKDVEDLVDRTIPLVVATPGRDGLPGSLTPQQIMDRVAAPGPFQIIFVGNLIPRKELHSLLAALVKLSRRDWRLTVTGSLDMDRVYVKAIRRQIADSGLAPRVSLLGALPPKDLAARCAAAHLLAVPSSYEGFGIVYLEGMQFGLPAIASTAGAARELIHPGHNGFLVDPGDIQSLAGCLSRLLDDRELLKTMSLNAYRFAATHPTWDDTAARIRAFLQGVAA